MDRVCPVHDTRQPKSQREYPERSSLTDGSLYMDGSWYTGRSPRGMPALAAFDRTPDHWTRFRGTVRREVWEDGRGTGVPDIHVVFGSDGNLDVSERDVDGDGIIDVRDYYTGSRLIRREFRNAVESE